VTDLIADLVTFESAPPTKLPPMRVRDFVLLLLGRDRAEPITNEAVPESLEAARARMGTAGLRVAVGDLLCHLRALEGSRWRGRDGRPLGSGGNDKRLVELLDACQGLSSLFKYEQGKVVFAETVASSERARIVEYVATNWHPMVRR